MSNVYSKKQIGAAGEEAAAALLINKGYDILQRNFSYRRLGEIDIVALKDGVIRFIEVKTRSSGMFGLPSESVDRRKMNKLRFLAQVFILLNRQLTNHEIGFDVIEVFVSINPENIKTLNMNHIENSF